LKSAELLLLGLLARQQFVGLEHLVRTIYLCGRVKKILRVFVSAIAALAAYYVAFLVSLILPAGRFQWLRFAGSLLCAVGAVRFSWRHTASASQGLATCVVLGAVVTGGIGFAGGFFGPIVFDPGANQGPLLGIFITGPLGFVAGAVGGAIYWWARVK
jgi:hypothetical protein